MATAFRTGRHAAPVPETGVAWMAEMAELGLGGCLADDMGLGKTVQLIALHLHRQERPTRRGPTLVVCPASLLGNWERELRRFAPGAPVRRYHGGDRHLDDLGRRRGRARHLRRRAPRRRRAGRAGLGSGRRRRGPARQEPAGRARRERCAPSRAGARIALTGTPVENRLTELWAILDWTTPGLLGPLERFRRRVAMPVERDRDPDATARLARLVRPFLLRRRKTDPGIAPDLPPKTETDRRRAADAEQVTLYEAVVRETHRPDRRGRGHRPARPRAQAAHRAQADLQPPRPVPAARPGRSPAGRASSTAFDELVDTIVAEGDSVLVFTQYVAMGRAARSATSPTRGVGHAVPARRHAGARRASEMVERFQAGEVPVFVLSLKAGGTGLNLTRATHVVHYDRWWNPAVEDQATDRAYRIGQDRPVQVHRLICRGHGRGPHRRAAGAKRALADAVVGAGEAWLARAVRRRARRARRPG